jgi:hypothetical protein
MIDQYIFVMSKSFIKTPRKQKPPMGFDTAKKMGPEDFDFEVVSEGDVQMRRYDKISIVLAKVVVQVP